MRHEGKEVTKAAPPGPKGVANAVFGGAALASGVEVGVELVSVDETGTMWSSSGGGGEGVLEVPPTALMAVAVAVVAAATVVDTVFVISQEKDPKIQNDFN